MMVTFLITSWGCVGIPDNVRVYGEMVRLHYVLVRQHCITPSTFPPHEVCNRISVSGYVGRECNHEESEERNRKR